MRNHRRNYHQLLAIFAALCLALVPATQHASAQLPGGAIIVPEFFEELYQVPETGGGAIDLLDSTPTQSVLIHNLAIADQNTAYFNSFTELYKFDFSTGQRSFITELSSVPQEITIDTNGDLIAVVANELFRVDSATGAASSVYDETFFGPSDAVVASTGNIYLTEFFDGLGVVSPSGVFTKIGNFDPNQFNHIDLGPDGNLYLSTTHGASLFRVNPTSGIGTELDTDVFTFIDDLQVDASGDILIAGEVDSKSGVFRFNPTSKALTTIVDQTMVNDGFFNPTDIAIYHAGESFAAADLDQNGIVNGADLGQLRQAYAMGAGGDIDRDGDTDGMDVLAWQSEYSIGSGQNLSSVPEPSTLALLLVSVVGCYLGKSRRF